MKKILFVVAAFLALATSSGLDRAMAADAASQTATVEMQNPQTTSCRPLVPSSG